VVATDLTRRYGEGDAAVDALAGVSTGFERGRFTAIMGPSGSGKSTLMHILAGRESDDAWIGSVVKTVHLEDRLEHRPSELSGGQQQRVAVARALAGRPKIIFADEPTGNLDSKAGTEILRFMRQAVLDYQQTIVMVTHDPVAASYANRVLFLSDGHIVSQLFEPTSAQIIDRMKQLGDT
jgi:putative ABC transport system ATP-binding protein